MYHIEVEIDGESKLYNLTLNKHKYHQKYKKEWENMTELEWVSKSSKGEEYAYCKVCDAHIRITGGKTDLFRHSSRAKHFDNLSKCVTLFEENKIDLKIDTFWHFDGLEPVQVNVDVDPYYIADSPKENQIKRKPVQTPKNTRKKIKKKNLPEPEELNEDSDSVCSCPWVTDDEDEYDAYGKDIAAQLNQIEDSQVLLGTKWKFDQILKHALEVTGGVPVTSVKDNSTNTPPSILVHVNPEFLEPLSRMPVVRLHDFMIKSKSKKGRGRPKKTKDKRKTR